MFVATASVLALLSAGTHAFRPYHGTHDAPLTSRDFIFNPSLDRFVRYSLDDDDASAVVVGNGGDFDAKITVRATSGRNAKKTYVITLNEDGTGTCSVNGKLIAGRKRMASARGTASGSSVKIKTNAVGTWTLGEGVRTAMTFKGKTNGIPTTITGYMDLTSEGKYQISLKTTYEKGNDLFAKPSVVKFGL